MLRLLPLLALVPLASAQGAHPGWCATGHGPAAAHAGAGGAGLDGTLFTDGRFTPFVVRSDVDETVMTLEVADPAVLEVAWPTYGAARRGAAVVDTLYLRDDGLRADRAAGDGTFTAAPARFVYDGSLGPIAGFANGGRPALVRYADRTETVSVDLALSLGILPADTEPVRPRRGDLAPGVDRTDHVVATVGAFGDLEGATARLLALTPEEPDFVVVAGPPADPSSRAAGFFARVKNEVEGVGLGAVDRSAAFGATGRLRGVVRVYPFPNLGLLNHEIGHNWFAFLDPALDLARGSHWGAIERPSTGFGSPNWGAYPDFDRVSGDTVRVDVRDAIRDGRYNDLELYLMGLIGPDEVAPVRTLVNPRPVGFEFGTRVFLADGVREVTIDEIVAVEGARRPVAGQAQTAFTVQTHVVYDRPLTDLELTFYDLVMRRYEQPSLPDELDFVYTFEAATGGRATVTTRTFSTGVAAGDPPARRPALELVGPNPVRSVARFRVDLEGGASLAVYDVLGRRVADLAGGSERGVLEVAWDAAGAAPGVYTAVLRSRAGLEAVRLTVVR